MNQTKINAAISRFCLEIHKNAVANTTLLEILVKENPQPSPQASEWLSKSVQASVDSSSAMDALLTILEQNLPS